MNRLQARNNQLSDSLFQYLAERHNDLYDLGFTTKDMNEMIDWCTDQFERDGWEYMNGVFYFKKDSDRLLFLLRWA